MIKTLEVPLLCLALFFLLGGAIGWNPPFILLLAAIIIHFL